MRPGGCFDTLSLAVNEAVLRPRLPPGGNASYRAALGALVAASRALVFDLGPDAVCPDPDLDADGVPGAAPFCATSPRSCEALGWSAPEATADPAVCAASADECHGWNCTANTTFDAAAEVRRQLRAVQATNSAALNRYKLR